MPSSGALFGDKYDGGIDGAHVIIVTGKKKKHVCLLYVFRMHNASVDHLFTCIDVTWNHVIGM